MRSIANIQNYTDDSIETLKPLEGIRKKLPMYTGSTGNDAVHHIIKELISNSIDEYLAGFGTRIEITIDKNTITVKDFGRGMPLGKIEDIFTKTHTSGKFKKDGEAAYGSSGGLNGVGCKIGTSTGKIEVEVQREGQQYKNYFTYNTIGQPEIKKVNDKATYSQVSWTPDSEPFSDNRIIFDKVLDLIKDLSYITPKLEFILKEGKKEEVVKSKSIADFLTENINLKDQLSPIMTFSSLGEELSVEGAMVWTKNTEIEKSYVNIIPTIDGGTHITAFKTTLTRELNKFLNSDLKGSEIRTGLSFIISVKTIEEPAFKGQSKDSLNMPTINAPLSQLLKYEIEAVLQTNKTFFEKLEKAIQTNRKKSNTQALLRELTTQKPKGILRELSDKYKGCSDNFNIELFLTEGDSAAGNLNPTKNHKNQAVFALKGKPYNSFSQDLDKVLKNAEIKNLIEILGTERQALKKFDKIILAADADNDGVAIINLLLGFFVTFYKELIMEGRIYIPELPKYLAVDPKGENHFFYADESLDSVPKSWHITYFKGLGEMSAAQLGRFTTNTKTRKLIQIKTDEDGFEELYTSLQLALSKDKEDVDNRRELLL